ncbi:MAG: Ig-like domain-containing protein [Gemmatales bacterium]
MRQTTLLKSVQRLTSRKLVLEILEDRTLLAANVYVPDSTARSWMSNEVQRLITQPTSTGYLGDWIVGVAPGQSVNQLSISAGASHSTATGIVNNAYQWNFSSDLSPTIVASWLHSRLNSGQIEFFYPLLARQQHTRLVPNDPEFTNQWHLRNTGQGGGTLGIDANVVTAWNNYLGTGVQIGVVDTGVTVAHPDLQPNVWVNPGEIAGNGIDDDGNGLIDDVNGWDWNDSDNDPTPQFDDHGTSVAGVAAARGNNGIGVSGVAPGAQIIGERLIEGGTTDDLEAMALSYQRDITDIYTNSWGPSDDGVTLEGPGPLLLAAFANNYANGRGGLGNIYTWAGGNGGDFDNSNYDGYANSRFVIGVAAVDNTGVRSFYSERGANILVAAPSDGGTLGITTTAGTSTPGYTADFGGTSSATPVVAGVIALMLEARPDLTARDVQYILVNTSRHIDAGDAGWSRNNGGTGFWINDKYGFGLVDANAAVNLAQTWTKVAPQISQSSGVINSGLGIPDADPTGITVTFNETQDMKLEHVEFVVDITHTWRGDLKFLLTSPKGTQSIVEARNGDSTADFQNWKFMSVRNWGESPVGTWKLQIIDTAGADIGTLNSFQMNFFGQLLAVPPTASNDAYTTAEDTTLTVLAPGVLANDLLATSAQLVSNVSNGTLTFFSTGRFRYVPNANFNGTDSFTYNAVNQFGTSTATVTITVTPVNDAPVAVNDGTFIARPGRTLVVNSPTLLANDSDVDNPPGSLSASLFTSPTFGNVILNGNGTFSYLALQGSGVDSFLYRAYDGAAFSTPATVTIRLNTPPVVQSANVFTTVGVPYTGNALTGASDYDHDSYTASLISTTPNGTLNLLPNGSFTYTPNAGFFGIDTFTFRADDPYYNALNLDQIGNTGTISIRVNRLPVTQVENFTTRQGQTLEVFFPGVLSNDYDLDTALFGDVVQSTLVTPTTNGSLTLNSNGYFKYVPNPNFFGSDSFTYRTFDGLSFGNIVTVPITVVPVPIARPDGYAVNGAPLTVNSLNGVLANDTSPSGPPLNARLINAPLNGSLTLNPDGSFTYVPRNGSPGGVDYFTYVANDGTYDSDPALVTLNVFVGSRAPVANNDSYTMAANSVLTIPNLGVLSNDTDPQGNPLISTLVTGTRNGTLLLNQGGGFTYTPLTGFNGVDTFTYQASNRSLLSNVATVTITVGTIPPPPLNPAKRIILGKDTGGELRVLAGETGATLFTIQPYGASFTGAIRVATGDLNGDGVPDIIAAPGPLAGTVGNGAVLGIRVFNGATGAPLSGSTVLNTWGTGVKPFGSTYTGGMQVAVGDVNNDGKLDIVAGADSTTASPQVRTYNGNTAAFFTQWYGGISPYTGTFGGVRVAVGDVNGDGKAEIITSPGAGTPTVKVYDSTKSTVTLGLIRSFSAYSTNVAGGVYVAAGDLNGDGKAEIITGAAANANGQVRIFNGTTGVVQNSLTIAGTSGPVRVAVGDINGDGQRDLVLSHAVSGAASKARVYDAVTLSELLAGQFNYGTFNGGLNVAALAK